MECIYVRQDGADFYIYADSKCKKFVRVETAPFPVKDFDMNAAIRARKWFDKNVSIQYDLHWRF